MHMRGGPVCTGPPFFEFMIVWGSILAEKSKLLIPRKHPESIQTKNSFRKLPKRVTGSINTIAKWQHFILYFPSSRSITLSATFCLPSTVRWKPSVRRWVSSTVTAP